MGVTILFTGLARTTQLVLLKDNIIIQADNQVMLHQLLQLIHHQSFHLALLLSPKVILSHSEPSLLIEVNILPFSGHMLSATTIKHPMSSTGFVVHLQNKFSFF
jgi:hypothetical protein